MAALSFLPKLFNAFNISKHGGHPHRVNNQELLNNFILLVKVSAPRIYEILILMQVLKNILQDTYCQYFHLFTDCS